MWKIIFNVVSQLAFIALAAVFGAFSWIHGSAIFNDKYGRGIGWLEAIKTEFGKYPDAWLWFAVVFLLLAGIVVLRTLMRMKID